MSTPDPNEAMGMENDPYIDEQEHPGTEESSGAGTDTATSAVGTGAAESDTSVTPGEDTEPPSGR